MLKELIMAKDLQKTLLEILIIIIYIGKSIVVIFSTKKHNYNLGYNVYVEFEGNRS